MRVISFVNGGWGHDLGINSERGSVARATGCCSRRPVVGDYVILKSRRIAEVTGVDYVRDPNDMFHADLKHTGLSWRKGSTALPSIAEIREHGS